MKWVSPATEEALVFARAEWSPRALVHAGWVRRYDHAAPRRMAMDLRARARRALRDLQLIEWAERWARRGDGPARHIPHDTMVWRNHRGQLHRDGAPALIQHGIKLCWHIDGALSRTDGGPALIHASGRREWYVAGERHRADGPALIDTDGSLGWFLHGERHRVDGPAVIMADGRTEWWHEGVRHRSDGPAITHRPGHGHPQWWVHGRRTTPLDDAFIAPPAGAPVDLMDHLFCDGVR